MVGIYRWSVLLAKICTPRVKIRRTVGESLSRHRCIVIIIDDYVSTGLVCKKILELQVLKRESTVIAICLAEMSAKLEFRIFDISWFSYFTMFKTFLA